LGKNAAILKEYISKNLLSEQTPKVIEMIEAIETNLEKKDLTQLKDLSDRIEMWINVNLGATKVDVNMPADTDGAKVADTDEAKVAKTDEAKVAKTDEAKVAKTDEAELATYAIAIDITIDDVLVGKEFGDGFSNFSSGKNMSLVGLVLALENKGRESLNVADLNLQLVFANKKIIESSVAATEALNGQEGLSNIASFEKPNTQILTGVAFIVPSTKITENNILFEIWRDTNLIVRSPVNIPKQ